MKYLPSLFPLLLLALPPFLKGAVDEILPVLAWRGEEVVWLEREPAEVDGEARFDLAEMVEAQLAGLSAAEEAVGLQPFLPAHAVFAGIEIEEGRATIFLDLPAPLAADEELERLQQPLALLLGEWELLLPEFHQISFLARYSDGIEVRVDGSLPPPASKPGEGAAPAGDGDLQAMSVPQAPAQGTAQPTGALSDASIFLSPGHGWEYVSVLGRWATQRGNNHQYIEDHGTAEAVLQYLHQYLWNAGARIYTTRERCMNTNMVIVQHGGIGYSQTGSWTVEGTSGAYGNSHRWASTVTGSPSATARYTPNIPEDGHYGVYVWYSRSGGGTTTADARMTVNHTGDSTTWVQNQNRDGFTWKYIGTYYFEKGVNPATGSVVIDNQSSVGGRRVIAGAVRFGGGMGDVPDATSGTISGKPRWEEAGRYYAAFMGMPNWETGTRAAVLSRYAAYEQEAWEVGKSAYVSWHTNAGGGTGTETWSHTSPPPGSFELRNLIQDQLVKDIRVGWKSNWSDRGTKASSTLSAELSPTHNPDMPAALTEIAFHDHVEDTKHLLDPEFRRQAARAVYKALVRYYAAHVPGFNNSTFLPEPPQRLRVKANDNGTITLTWEAPAFSTGTSGFLGHAATGYRVYRSKNGRGFDNGISVPGTTVTLGGFEPNEVVYFRVSATNAGGESFPTATLAARSADNAPGRLLIVNGFNRNDRFMNVIENDPHSANPLQRGYVDRLNTFNYIIPHARAIEAYPDAVSFDAAEAAAVENGSILLADYDAVIWMAGLQAHVNDIGTRQTPVLWGGLPSRIANYTSGGGKFFLSGAEVAYDLNRAGLLGFLRGIFRADYVQRSANTHHAQGTAGSILAGLAAFQFGDASGPVYRIDNPNVIAPINGSVRVLEYPPVQTVEDFESSAGWLNPMSAGQTNAAGSTFSIVSSPVIQGNGAGRLTYNWGTGNFIRLHRTALPAFNADSDLSLWVHGDGSGHQVQLAARDSDNDIFTGPLVTVDWTGWREISWQDVRNTGILWHQGGDGAVTSDTLRFDGIFLRRAGSTPNTGALHFDQLTATPTAGAASPAAGVAYDGNYQLVYVAVPFESIASEAKQADLMTRVLDFFQFNLTPFEKWLREFFTIAELADPEISGEFADASKDGVPNIVKYALNLHPREPSRAGLPEISVEDGFLTFRYNQAKGATDLLFEVEISDDLAQWRSGEEDVEIVSTVDEGETWRVTVRDKTPFPENERRFMRLRVTRL